MPRLYTHVLAVAALSLIVLVGAGCGKSKPKTTTQTTTTAAASTTTATSTAMTTTPATTSTTAAAGASGLAGIATSANCLQLAGLGASFARAITGAGGSVDVQKTATLLQQFADRTPSAIRPDFEVVAAAYAKIAAALKGVNLTTGQAPSAAAIARLTALGAQINSAALRKADADITAWARTNCGHA